MSQTRGSQDDRANGRPLTRRAAVGVLGAATAGGFLAGRPGTADAAVTNLYRVVDAGGTGDFTSIETAVAT